MMAFTTAPAVLEAIFVRYQKETFAPQTIDRNKILHKFKMKTDTTCRLFHDICKVGFGISSTENELCHYNYNTKFRGYAIFSCNCVTAR